MEIPGVGPRNLRKLVEKGIGGVAELKQSYKDKEELRTLRAAWLLPVLGRWSTTGPCPPSTGNGTHWRTQAREPPPVLQQYTASAQLVFLSHSLI
uniref:Uncharacterized protein n=1 Tax=Fagus sylvatica TaxID=28930 RepID=A0A2N9I828_FAGSY